MLYDVTDVRVDLLMLYIVTGDVALGTKVNVCLFGMYLEILSLYQQGQLYLARTGIIFASTTFRVFAAKSNMLVTGERIPKWTSSYHHIVAATAESTPEYT